VISAVGVVLGLAGAVVMGGDVEGQPGQPDVVIVGDSLTSDNASSIGPALAEAGVEARLEGLGARQIAVSIEYYGYRDSGVERIRSLRAAGVDPALWVIQLGTNDLGAIATCQCPDRVAFAVGLIDQLLAEVPPNRPIAWVTVMNRADFDVTNAFNEALRRRAVRNPYMRLIDWSRLSLERPDWFIDAVHPNVDGAARFTQMLVDDISALLAAPPGPAPTQPGMQRATRLGTPL
jgi:lysophospholipase L1-like esterase